MAAELLYPYFVVSCLGLFCEGVSIPFGEPEM